MLTIPSYLAIESSAIPDYRVRLAYDTSAELSPAAPLKRGDEAPAALLEDRYYEFPAGTIVASSDGHLFLLDGVNPPSPLTDIAPGVVAEPPFTLKFVPGDWAPHPAVTVHPDEPFFVEDSEGYKRGPYTLSGPSFRLVSSEGRYLTGYVYSAWDLAEGKSAPLVEGLHAYSRHFDTEYAFTGDHWVPDLAPTADELVITKAP